MTDRLVTKEASCSRCDSVSIVTVEILSQFIKLAEQVQQFLAAFHLLIRENTCSYIVLPWLQGDLHKSMASVHT